MILLNGIPSGNQSGQLQSDNSCMDISYDRYEY